MKNFWQEFKQFAVKGNVIDLAVAVVIGGAFGKIVSSLVADIVMPLLGVVMGGFNFAGWKVVLKKAVLDNNGEIYKAGLTMNIGNFLQNIFDFLIIALSIFLVIRILMKIKEKLLKEEKKVEDKEKMPKITEEQQLLIEIRDILKNAKSQEKN